MSKRVVNFYWLRINVTGPGVFPRASTYCVIKTIIRIKTKSKTDAPVKIDILTAKYEFELIIGAPPI